MLNLFASDTMKKILASLLFVSGGLAVQLPPGLAKTIASYVTLVLGGGGILSGGLASLQPPAVQLTAVKEPEPPHFRVNS